MKKIIFSIFIVALLVFSCTKEEIERLEIADFLVHVSGEDQATAFNVAIDKYLTFLDISQNAIDHEWKIEEGNFFISDEFSNTDSVFTAFIIPDAGSVSKEQKVNILFTEAGLQPIQIVNTFDKPIAAGPVQAVQQGGVWVADTTYMIDVFANLQPAFKVLRGTEEVLSVSANDLPDPNNSSTWPIIEVEAGQTLTYVDLTTTGRPNGRNWNLEGAVPASSQDSLATVSYFTLGSYVGGGFRSERGGDRPAQEAAKVIPIQVKVIPSSLPFLFDGNLMEQADEIITFNVGGELQPFSGQEGTFTVNVVNSSAGFNENIPVQLAKVSDSDATKIELKLSTPIYNSDVITVSYAGADIKSADFRTLSEFGPETVTMHFEPNAMDPNYTGYELEQTGGNNKQANSNGFFAQFNGGSANGPTYFWRDTEHAFSGVSSMRFNSLDAEGLGRALNRLQGPGFASISPISAGNYKPKVWVYLHADNNMTAIEFNFLREGVPVNMDISNAPREQWVEVSTPAVLLTETPGNGRWDLNVKVDAANNPDPMGVNQIFWVDQFELIPWEVRPN